MTPPYLTYPLDPDGYVHHWLVAGPLHLPATTPEAPEAPDIPSTPVQLDTFVVEGTTLRWDYARSREDHLLHRQSWCATPCRRRDWAYVELVSPEAQTVTATLTAPGRATVWRGDAAAYRRVHHQTAAGRPGGTFELILTAGATRLLVRCEREAFGPSLHLQALRLPGAAGVTLRLPCATARTARFQALERLFRRAALDRDVFIADDNLCVHWPDDLEPPPGEIRLRLQRPDGRIYAETLGTARPGDVTKTLPAANLHAGPYQLVLMPPPREYAEERVRVRRTFEVQVLDVPLTTDEDTPYVRRLYDAVHRAIQQEQGVLSELAAMTLNAWRFVHPEALEASLNRVRARAWHHRRDLVALLGIAARYGEHEHFPEGLNARIADEARTYVTDVPPPETEAQAALALAVRLLAGQPAPELEAEARGWLTTRGQFGLRTLLDDGDDLDALIFALSHMADLVADTAARELAAVLLDKVLFTLALHHHAGIGPAGMTGTTACLGRVLWGAGVPNPHLWGVVGLANARAYPVPPLIAAVARGAPDGAPALSRERHAAPDGAWAFERMSYRAPEYRLSSVPASEGIYPPRAWQASLGAGVEVFVTHPAHAGPEGYGRGVAVPPRVAQWRDALIASYRLPPDDWLGFTHAHVPLHACDAHALRDNWAFVRRGDAYLALTASTPLSWGAAASGARCELRAPGPRTVWLCQMGRRADDGDFAAFQARVLAQEVDLAAPTLRWTTPQGDGLTLAPDAPLRVNGQPVTLPAARHYATPFGVVDAPAEQMDIRVGTSLLRLDFT